MNINHSDNIDFQKFFPYEDGECKVNNRHEVVDKYLANELTEEEVLAFDEHTFYCDGCFDELQFREETASILRQQDDAQKKRGTFLPYFKKEELKQWGHFLAAAAILFVVLIIWNQKQADDQAKVFNANSKVSSSLEPLLNFRDKISILSPKSEVNIQSRFFGCAKPNLLFSWQREDSTKLDLIIVNNRGRELFTFSTTKDQVFFKDVTDKLHPGLYYWKLQDENELKYVGKFFVNKPE